MDRLVDSASADEVSAKCRITFWDLGGQSDLQTIWASYYAECHAILFIVDSCDKDRLEESCQALGKVMSNMDAEGVPVLMLANKQDVAGRAMTVEDIKTIFNKLAQQLDARDSRVIPVSALNGDGIREAMDWLRLRLQRNRHQRPPRLTNL